MDEYSFQLINSLLVPGVLIVASAILLFTTNSRYSLVVDRIRFLKKERSTIIKDSDKSKETLDIRDKIELQLSHLIHRIAFVRIIIISYSSAVVLFVVSSVFLAIRPDLEQNGYFWLSIAFIFGGLLGIVNGIVFSVIETFKAYRIVHIEFSDNSVRV